MKNRHLPSSYNRYLFLSSEFPSIRYLLIQSIGLTYYTLLPCCLEGVLRVHLLTESSLFVRETGYKLISITLVSQSIDKGKIDIQQLINYYWRILRQPRAKGQLPQQKQIRKKATEPKSQLIFISRSLYCPSLSCFLPQRFIMFLLQFLITIFLPIVLTDSLIRP